jgi:metal-responsive CopG/Arc/MetJ family transcriptional regulator
MRTLVDLGDAQIQALDDLSKKEKRSRAALIRQAIDDYLGKRRDQQLVGRNSDSVLRRLV